MTVPLDREVAARAIYDRRPFRTTSSERVMDPLATRARELAFDDAPAFYQDECYELADAVIAALRLGSFATGDDSNADLVRHELRRRMKVHGSARQLACEWGFSRQLLGEVVRGNIAPSASISARLGFRRRVVFERVG